MREFRDAAPEGVEVVGLPAWRGGQAAWTVYVVGNCQTYDYREVPFWTE